MGTISPAHSLFPCSLYLVPCTLYLKVEVEVEVGRAGGWAMAHPEPTDVGVGGSTDKGVEVVKSLKRGFDKILLLI